MALEIFKLVGSVFVDTDKANESLQKTDKKASNLASTFGTVASGVGKAAGLIIGGVAAVGGAAFAMADNVADSADEIDKASIRMGISAESYQELAYAAGQCGVEMSTMEMAAKKLEGTDLNFDDAINQIMSLSTAEERSAAAAELFGDKVAYNLSPLIEQSTSEFDGLIQRANDLGLVMSGDAVKAGVEFGDLLSDIKQVLGSLVKELGSALFPILIDIIKNLLTFMPQIQSYVSMIAPILADVVSQILPIFFDIISQILPVAIQIVEEILPVLLQIFQEIVPLIMALMPLIAPLTDLLFAILEPLLKLISDILPPVISALTQIITGVMPALIKIVEVATGTITFYFNEFIALFMPSVNACMQVLNGLGTFLTGVFTGNWEMAWEGIKDIFKGVINVIIQGLASLVNQFIFAINMVINTAARLVDAIPGIDIPVNDIKIPMVELPMLAKGGNIIEEGAAIVGEAGAELVTLPKGARVSPLNNNGIDYDKLADAIVSAIQRTGMGKIDTIVVQNKFGNQNLQSTVIDALALANYRSGGR